jgi:polyisoprenoid-binding protein YceI
MFKRIALLLLVVIGIGTQVRAEVWQFDKAHSHIGFSVRHMVISNVLGAFSDYTGTVNFDGKQVENGTVDITIQTASINTENERRDTDLKSPGFFDAAKFPTITFKSTKITKSAGDKFSMVGDFTMKGVTKEITLDCQFIGTITDPGGNARAGFSATTTINRQDFGVSWSNKLADGSLIVGNDVTIKLEIELVKGK